MELMEKNSNNSSENYQAKRDVSISLRAYQIMLIEKCCNENCVIYLPTGSGKTFIAVHALKKMCDSLLFKPLAEGGKRAVFLVPTKALVHQTAAVLRDQTPYKLGVYTGDVGVDYWTKARWHTELHANQVLIMPPAVMQNILKSAFISLSIFSLVVLDECHHAVDDNPFRAVMRELQNVDEGERPRIIGMSAALLNRTVSPASVTQEVEALERTMHGKIVTCDELSDVLEYSTNPTEQLITYAKYPHTESSLFDGATIASHQDIKKLLNFVEKIEDMKAKVATPMGYLMAKKKNVYYKIIRRALEDFSVHLTELGIYPASVAALYHNISFYMERMVCESSFRENVYAQTEILFTHFRSALLKLMADDESPENIVKFCSPKVQNLIRILQTFASKREENSLVLIIFVTRRVTAIVLNYILQKLAHSDGMGLEAYKLAFVVGGDSNPFQLSREQELEKKYFQKTMSRFRAEELNALVATNVIEEGVDIPDCNLVIKFNSKELDYRSYFQAKGRARSKNSTFLLFTSDVIQTKKKIDIFLNIRNNLHRLLIGRNNERNAPNLAAIEEDVYVEDVEPYYVAGPNSAHVNGITAIPCIFHYCSRLPQDIFSKLEPLVFTKRLGKRFKAVIQLPSVSPYRDLIEGDQMANSKSAKRSAFINAVKILHKNGELNDNLKPAEIVESAPEYDHIFQHYVKEDSDGRALPGTNRRKRVYPIMYPIALNFGLPQPEIPLYLHVISFSSDSGGVESDRLLKMKQQYVSGSTYAILTTNKCPKICSFPLYTSACELSCELLTDYAKLSLNQAQLDLVAHYHLQLFSSVIPVTKSFQLLSRQKDENSYYIVPVLVNARKTYDIDWTTITNIRRYTTKVEENSESFVVNNETHNLAVISPFYRDDNPRRQYLVTKVCFDMSPLSKFPSETTKDFVSYFRAKYDVNIKNFNQPLLEVKPMPKLRNNFLRMRETNPNAGISRRRRLMEGSDFNETLVPELCDRYLYPSALWMKGYLLPSVLYRITTLLLVEELFARISLDTKIGLSRGQNWSALVPEKFFVEGKDDLELSSMLSQPKTLKSSSVYKQPPLPTVQGKEPELIYLNMDKVAECDLQYYVEYAKRPFTTKLKTAGELSESRFWNPYKGPVLPLKTLDLGLQEVLAGPQLRDILATVTAKSANDIINMERLETFGDSFLKFASAVFLFREFPKMNEGGMVAIKNKLVSNRNLLYCAQAKNLTNLLQVDEFCGDDWVPPSIIVPPEIRKCIWDLKKDPRLLYDINLSPEEQLTGVIQQEKLFKIRAMILKDPQVDDELRARSETTHLGHRSLSDKTVADSVEAILGAYLQASGFVAGFNLLNWFDILPADKGSYSTLMGTRPPSPMFPSSNQREVIRQLEKVNYKELEKTIGYTFADKAYLLQALTHATFLFHNATPCYQRLELLGDAVLDVLVTCFIFEQCPDLDPGKITLLRSALVNNNTFASLVVRYGLHRYLLYACPALADAISFFATFQEGRNHIVDEAVSVLLEEQDCNIAESVEVPKALGDIFEALAGAIFLDSGNSMKAVWDVFYKLMKTELDTFPSRIPKNAIQILHESVNAKQLIIESSLSSHGPCRTKVEINLPSGKILTAYGFGLNKFESKRSAAKLAMKLLNA